jgi:hypothetical protein
MSALIPTDAIGGVFNAKALVAIVSVPEPGTISTLAVYAVGVGLFLWYWRRRAKRSKL